MELSRVIASSTGWDDGCDQAAATFVKVGLQQGLSSESLLRELCGYGLSRAGAKILIEAATEFGGSQEAHRANATLSTLACICAFILGFGFFPGIALATVVTFYLKSRGYKRRVNEFWRCWYQGFLFFVMIPPIVCVSVYVGTWDIKWLMVTVGFAVLWWILARVGKKRLSQQLST
ncbi:MAG: hypothetical protein ACYC26_11225 [Phycisphaerales bacterium]